MKKRKWKVIVALIAVLVSIMAILVFLNLPKSIISNDSAYKLSQLSDSTYIGNCDNGIVQVQVAVDVKSNAISDIRILHHQNGLGSAAEAITDDIVKRQSIEVDSVSGATMSSKTILKAVENALSGTGE